MTIPRSRLSALLTTCLAVNAALILAWACLDQEWFVPLWFPFRTGLIAIPLICSSTLAVGLAILAVRARAAAAESTEAKFRSLLDAAPDPMVIMNGDGLVTLVNARAEALFRAPRERLIGKPVDGLLVQSGWRADLLHSSTPRNFDSSAPAAEQEPQLQARCRDGSLVPVEITFSPLKTDQGTFTISIIRDITERKKVERLRDARHAARRILADKDSLDSAGPLLLQAICESLDLEQAVLWTVDPKADRLFCSVSWGRPEVKELALWKARRVLTHLRGGGLPGRIWAAAEPLWRAHQPQGASPAASDDEWRAPSQNLEPGRAESEGSSLGGRHSPLANSKDEASCGAFGFPILFGADVLGVIECFSAQPRSPEPALLDTLHNIGSQIGRFLKHARAEEAVRRSEARKAAILEAALDAIITIDHEDKILEFNPAAERLFRVARREALGQKMADLIVAADSHNAYRQALISCVEPEADATPGGPLARPGPSESWRAAPVVFGQRLELSLRRSDGAELPVEMAVTRIQADGPVLFTCYVRDLRERKQSEEALKRTEEQCRQGQKIEAVGRLAGGVAHDFNNLLTVINGYTQSMLRQLPAEDPNRARVELINKAGIRAADLTRQLLAFSRKQRLETTVFQLNTVVADLSKMLQRLIGEDVNLATIAGPNLLPIRADLGQIEQVIMNLAVNARDAMPGGGKLTLETANIELDAAYAEAHTDVAPGPYVLLAISDTGVGMTDEVKARIFEPFFTTKEIGKGTGLGLAMVYGIIKQSGGHINVYSEPGHGTTFKIYLPCVNEKPSAAVAPSRRLAAVPRGKGTVLLVEDEDMVRTIGKEILQEQGYTVLEARHGREALDISDQEMDAVQLTVTDVVMPEMDGRELAQRLQRRRPGMKVLYVSGYTDNAAIRNGLLPPGTAFLEKPFTPESLAYKVHEVISGR